MLIQPTICEIIKTIIQTQLIIMKCYLIFNFHSTFLLDSILGLLNMSSFVS